MKRPAKKAFEFFFAGAPITRAHLRLALLALKGDTMAGLWLLLFQEPSAYLAFRKGRWLGFMRGVKKPDGAQLVAPVGARQRPERAAT